MANLTIQPVAKAALETESLILEPFEPSKHTKDIKRIFTDKDTMKLYHGAVLSDERLAKLTATWVLEAKDSPFGVFAIYTKKERQFVGHVALGQNDYPSILGISFALVPEQRKKGYGFEAVSYLVHKYALEHFQKKALAQSKPFRGIVAEVLKDNVRSQRLLTKVGFGSIMDPTVIEEIENSTFINTLNYYFPMGKAEARLTT